GMRLPLPDRYWLWAGYTTPDGALQTLAPGISERIAMRDFESRKSALLKGLSGNGSMNDVLHVDVKMVLAGDMLHKVDLMSMANSLEVRVPFLHVDVVNFLFTLHAECKITGKMRKRLLQDAFRDMLPPELYNRPRSEERRVGKEWRSRRTRDRSDRQMHHIHWTRAA